VRAGSYGVPAFALPRPDVAGVVLCTLHRLRASGDGNLRSLEDVFADRCLCRVNFIYFIDVGRVVVTSAAVNVIHLTVRSEDRVIGGTTEQIVLTETAVYAVVTVSATYHIETTATVAIVVARPSPDAPPQALPTPRLRH
jgi:hypothetical protein